MLISPLASFPTFQDLLLLAWCIFYSNVACFCCIFQLPIIVRELGSYLLFIYKYRNIKETLPSSLPISPTTLCAAFPISALKRVNLGPGIWCLLGSVPLVALAFLPAVSLPCASISLVQRAGGDHPAEGAGSPTPVALAWNWSSAEYCFRNPLLPVCASFPR